MEIRVTQAPTVFVPQSISSLRRRADNTEYAAIEADLMPAFTELKLAATATTYVGAKGDLIAMLTDLDAGARKRTPALVLAHKANPRERNVFIPLTAMWLLIDPDIPDDAKRTRENREKQQHAIRALAGRLYGFVTADDTYRVIDALYDFADDLKNAKPPRGFNHTEWLEALAADDMKFLVNGVALNG